VVVLSFINNKKITNEMIMPVALRSITLAVDLQEGQTAWSIFYNFGDNGLLSVANDYLYYRWVGARLGFLSLTTTSFVLVK
jgi:hypothetical protein